MVASACAPFRGLGPSSCLPATHSLAPLFRGREENQVPSTIDSDRCVARGGRRLVLATALAAGAWLIGVVLPMMALTAQAALAQQSGGRGGNSGTGASGGAGGTGYLGDAGSTGGDDGFGRGGGGGGGAAGGAAVATVGRRPALPAAPEVL
jgi:hypothetical protein